MTTEPSAPIVEVSFSAHGDAVAADHGFSLFSAISREWPGVHANPNVAILPIQGLPSGDRMLSLKRNSSLTLRLPVDQLPAALAFAGKTLLVGSNRMLLGVPTVRLLRPAPSLRSRLVVIKGSPTRMIGVHWRTRLR